MSRSPDSVRRPKHLPFWRRLLSLCPKSSQNPTNQNYQITVVDSGYDLISNLSKIHDPIKEEQYARI
jgi:hypothetical protein